jgi:signal recognition particle subunit SEC65
MLATAPKNACEGFRMKKNNAAKQAAVTPASSLPVIIQPTPFDALGLTSRELSREQWDEIGRFIGSEMRRAAFVIGDWLIFAEERTGQLNFGDAMPAENVSHRVYQQAVELTGIDITTLQNYAYVARHVPRDIRNPRVSWEHHKKVAKLKDAGAKTNWLKVVEKASKTGDRITARRLARSIVAGKLVTRDEMESRDSDRGIESVGPYVNRIVVFIAKLRAAGWIDGADEHKLRALARDLQQVVEIAAELNKLADAIATGRTKRR